jgi:hypothetical protein
LGAVEGREVLLGKNDPFGWGDSELQYSFLWGTPKVGMGLEYSAFQAFDYDYRERKYALGFGKKVTQHFSVGAGVSFESIRSLENASGSFGSLGVLYQSGRLETGLAYQHFGRYSWSTKSKQAVPGELQASLKIQHTEKLAYLFGHSSAVPRKITSAIRWLPITGLALQLEDGASGLQFGLSLSTRGVAINYSLAQSDLGIGSQLTLGFKL